MIKSMTNADILGDPFKWGEHLWFEIPLEGGDAALAYHSDNGQGYGFLVHMQDEDPFLEVDTLPAHKAGVSVTAIGDMIHLYDEERRIWLHAVYTHSVEAGWHPAFYAKDPITLKLDEWWAEHEEDVVWPMRSVMFGHGNRHMRIGEYRAQTKVMLASQANTEAEFALFWED